MSCPTIEIHRDPSPTTSPKTSSLARLNRSESLRAIKSFTNYSKINSKAIQYRLSFICGNEKNQSAAAWLAAATHQLSCLNSHHISKQKSIQQSNQNQNRFQKQTKSLDDYDEEQRSKEESFLQKDQRHQRVRRTSILRRQPSFSNEKKNVRFADSIGLKLENILYFQPPSTPVRRFTSPANSNSEWNAQTWHGILCDRFVAPTCDLNRSNKSDSNNRDGEEIHKNLDKAKQQAFDSLDSQQRYELVMSNFSNPSERFDFTQVLCEKNVLLHSITISETTIYGIVSCLNIHFIKKVYVRYTFDDWSTQIEREANYMLGSHDGRTDKFSFCIYSQPKDFKIFDGTENDMIASERNKSSSEEDMSDGSDDKENRPQMIDSKRCPRIYFAIRFRSGDGQEFWDNNHGQNYRLDLKRLS
ncbi:Protein phosphatase 1 regulatory subunit 3A [Sarcoptes scabiei]|nr:Protein phosphatase 1 regulatory subunit 3A [Sarcoptes scabiei]